MLTYDEMLNFISEIGNYIISNEEGEMLYVCEDISLSEQALGKVKKSISRIPVDLRKSEWELADNITKKYYKIKIRSVEVDRKKYFLHNVTDITEQIDVFRTISALSLDWEQSAKFQTVMLNKLRQSYVNILPDIAKQFGTDSVKIYVGHEKMVETVSYVSDTEKITTEVTDDFSVFETASFDEAGDYVCLASGEAGSRRYALIIHIVDSMDREKLDDVTLHSVVKLYIENNLLHSQVVWNNEHDSLTGLYNKGKYITLLNENFGNPNRITIFNMDVNNLKKMNDLFGHIAGDKLIIKAAKSLHMVSSDNVLGFRMGGDEFMLIALDLSAEEADQLKERWQSAVKKLNKDEDGIEIVLACGMVHAEGEYNLKELLEQADSLMYEDKKRLKAQV